MCIWTIRRVCILWREVNLLHNSSGAIHLVFWEKFSQWVLAHWIVLGDCPASSRSPPYSSSITVSLQSNTQNVHIDIGDETETLMLTMQGLPSPLNSTFLRLILILRSHRHSYNLKCPIDHLSRFGVGGWRFSWTLWKAAGTTAVEYYGGGLHNMHAFVMLMEF